MSPSDTIFWMIPPHLIEILRELTTEQRLEVLNLLERSLDSGEASEAHRLKLDERLDAFEANPSPGIPLGRS